MNRMFAWLLCATCLLTGCQTDGTFYDRQEEEDFYPEELLAEEETPDFGPALPLQFALPYSADSALDPITCATGMQQTVGSLLYEGLFALDETFAPQAVLCLAYTYQADVETQSFVYTLTLRNAMFSDGTPLTAEDVVDTLVRAKSSARYSARLKDMVAVKALDGAVTITLNRDNAQFTALLDIPIVKLGTAELAFPVGTGPYQASAEGTTLEPNPNWWYGTDLPVDTIALVNSPNHDLMQYRFTTHEVQLIATDLISTQPFQASGNISYYSADTTLLHYIGVNMANPQLQRANVRQALSLGIDRSALISAFLSGHGLSTQFPVSPVSALYPHSLDVAYRQAQYVAALGATGVQATPQTYTLIVNAENSFKVAAASFIATSLSQGNVTVKVRPLVWEDYVLALETGDYDLYYGEVQLTADWDWTSLLAGSLNYGGYSSEAMNAAMAEYQASPNGEEAMEALCQVFQAEQPIIPLCFKSTAVLAQSHVLEHNTHTQANPFYNISQWDIHLDGET